MKKNYSLYALLLLCLLNPNTLKPAQAEEEPAQQAPSEVPGLICKHCNEVFLKLTDLRSHEKSEKIKPSTEFYCSTCDYKSKKSSSLLKHLLTHTGERPFKCDICEKKFTQSSILTNHKKIHTGERPFECTMCLKTFKRKSCLTVHERIHTGEKPYKCDICSKGFSESTHLRRHEKSITHHRNADMLNGLTPPPYCPLTPPPAPIQAATSDQAPNAEPDQYDKDSECTITDCDEDSEYENENDETASESDDDNAHRSKRFHPTPAAPAPAPAPYKG
jgi:uncharacterized Zn-finger protein